MDCSETYEYSVTNEYTEQEETLHIYPNDLKYMKYNNIDINKVKSFPKDYNFSTIDARVNDCVQNGYDYLDLSHLNLDIFPETFTNKKVFDVKHLFVSNNNLTKLDLSSFKNLITLDLSTNKFKLIPTLPNTIEELSIKDNLIFAENLHKYKYLKRLDISNNKLINISVINSLEILLCDDNYITHIDSYSSIKKLSCERNNIHTIQISENLELLQCNENKIVKLSNFPNLKELYCNNNNIVSIYNLPLIDTLYCIKNKITTMHHFPTLKELACDYTSSLEISKKYNVKFSQIYDNYAVLFFE
jgi:hypothetical protein